MKGSAKSLATLLSVLLLTMPKVEAIFFFQDLKPANYRKGDMLDIHVGNLYSKTSANVYSFQKLDFCEPASREETARKSPVGLSSRDETIYESPYLVSNSSYSYQKLT